MPQKWILRLFLRWALPVFIWLFIPYFEAEVQALVSTPNQYTLQMREDSQLVFNEPSKFLGYFPSSFEKLKPLSMSILKSNWRDLVEPKKSYRVLVSLQSEVVYQRPYRELLMGTNEWPIHFSDLNENNEGRVSKYGTNGWFTVDASLSPNDWFFVRGRINAASNFRDPSAWYQIEELFSEVRLNRLILSVGRKPLFWGQNSTGPFLQSLNSKNLDMIELSSLPIILPYFLKYLGWVKTELFLSRMNDERAPENDYFTGWRLGMKPSDIFEFNLAGIYQWGGRGISSESWDHAIVEYLGGRIQVGDSNLDTSNFFNRAAVIDFRFVFSDWKFPTSFYSEHHIEDCCGNPIFLFKKAISYSYGVVVRSSREPDAKRFRVEYLRTGNATYYHLNWPSASSNAGRVMGNEIGRDAQKIYLEYAQEISRWKSELKIYSFWRERLRTGLFSTVSERPDVDAHELIPYFTESEKTTALGLDLKYQIHPSCFLDMGLMIDYVFNKEGRGGKNKVEGGAGAALTLGF